MKYYPLKLPSILGRRLMFAFATMTGLNLLIGTFAFMMWGNLSAQVNYIVEYSLPPLNATYQLERSSSELKSVLGEIHSTRNELKYQALADRVLGLLKQLKSAYRLSNRQGTLAGQQEQLLSQFSQLIERQNNLLQQQIIEAQQLDDMHKRIGWLHQDLIDETLPLMQEVEWHVSRLLGAAVREETPSALMSEFFVLQELSTRENELFNLVNEIIDQRYQRDLDSAFLYIEHKISEITKLNNKLTDYPSTISHRQIIVEILSLVRTEGQLYRQLRRDISIHDKLNSLNPELNNQLSQFHAQVRESLTNANQAFATLSDNTKAMVKRGKTLIILVSLISIVISVLVLVVLISRRLIKRLDQLGEDLANVADGHLEWPIATEGKDEIGRLGDSLRRFCIQMQAMVRSNALNLINNTQASLITCYPDGHIESVNPSALRLLGLKSVQADLPLWQPFIAPARDILEQQFIPDSDLLTTGSSECVIGILHGSGCRYLHFHLQRFEHARQNKYMITITDITKQECNARELTRLVDDKTQNLTEKNLQLAAEIEQRKQVEANLRQAQTDLIQSAKMAAVGQTMTSLAHELNQPLSAISTYLYSCRLALEQNQLQMLPQMLSQVEKLSLRMGKIISALRNFARKSPSNCEASRVDMAELIQSAFVLVETRGRSEACILCNQVPIGIEIMAAPVQIEQVLVNVLINAMDAIAGQADKQIHVCLLRSQANTHLLAIYDNGPGFDDDILPQIFTPFSTTKAVGLGLGLSICRAILERFNGQITLASNLEGGAMIILEFNYAQ